MTRVYGDHAYVHNMRHSHDDQGIPPKKTIKIYTKPDVGLVGLTPKVSTTHSDHPLAQKQFRTKRDGVEKYLIAKSMLAYSEKMREIGQNRNLIPFINGRSTQEKSGSYRDPKKKVQPKRVKGADTFDWQDVSGKEKDETELDGYLKGRPLSGYRLKGYSDSYIYPHRPASDPLSANDNLSQPSYHGYRRYGIDTTSTRLSKLNGETNVLTFNAERRFSLASSSNGSAKFFVNEQAEEDTETAIGVFGHPSVLHRTQLDPFSLFTKYNDTSFQSNQVIETISTETTILSTGSQSRITESTFGTEQSSADDIDLNNTPSVPSGASQLIGIRNETLKAPSTQTKKSSPSKLSRPMRPSIIITSKSGTNISNVDNRLTDDNQPKIRIVTDDKNIMHNISAEVSPDKALLSYGTKEKANLQSAGRDEGKLKAKQSKTKEVKAIPVEINAGEKVDSSLSPTEKSVQQAHLRLFGQNINEADVKKRLNKPKAKPQKKMTQDAPKKEVQPEKEPELKIILEDTPEIPPQQIEPENKTANGDIIKKKKTVKFGPEMIREVTKIQYPWYFEDSSDDDHGDNDDDDDDDDDNDDEDDAEEDGVEDDEENHIN